MENDYYSTVYSWFDKCGIIANIRTHLRQNLVNALKSKDLSLKGENDGPKSAKQYVYDLLIAEYLFDRNYAYALSVFASEAPLLVNFARQVTTPEGGESKQRLQNDYVSHTLDSLGIRSDDPEGQSIISKYSESEEPLLLCILHSLQSFSLKESESEEKQKEQRAKSFREIGTQTEKEDSRDQKLAAARKRLLKQKEVFDSELKEKEEKLRHQVVVVDRQLSLLQEKMEEAQDLMHNLQMKEKQFTHERRKEEQRICQKDMELSVKEKLLSQEADRLEKERDSYRQFEADLKKLQGELSKVKREFPSSTRNIFRDMHVQTDFESYTVLRRENEELNTLVRQQQARIEQLTLRAVRLSRHLEEIQLSRSKMQEMSTPVIKVIKNQTVVSESSSSEDLLQDAKMRLKRLEEESSKADRYYYNYITSS